MGAVSRAYNHRCTEPCRVQHDLYPDCKREGGGGRCRFLGTDTSVLAEDANETVL